MLKKLHIQNYALIEDLELNLQGQLNIITGETGAGKSILLGALGLLSGKRADVSVVRGDAKKCVIEGEFLIKNYGLFDFFESFDLDYEEITLIRREINANGKSRAFVNDSPVTLNVLKELGECLIDIHSQHANLLLANPKFSFDILDSIADQGELLSTYQFAYSVWLKDQKKLKQLEEEQEKEKLNLEFNQFQLNELEQAKLKVGEQEELEKEFELLNNSEDIKENCALVANTVMYGKSSISNQLQSCEDALSKLSEFDEEFSELSDRMASATIEIKDIAEDVESRGRGLSADSYRVNEIDERLTLLFGLQKKYIVSSVEHLIEKQTELSRLVELVEGGSEELDELKKSVLDQESKLIVLAKELSKGRVLAASIVSKEVVSDLILMGISQAQLEFQKEVVELNKFGSDLFQIGFSANKGKELGLLAKTASGGELSRVMLSLKRVLSSKSALPTIVFDEIDTGVSGEVADRMGDIMRKMGEGMQVLTITHLPQIAAKGNSHYKVYKSHDTSLTTSQLKELNKKERIEEIAQMLSGAKISQAALKNAEELLS